MAGSSTAPIVDRIRIIPRATDFLDRNVGSSGEVFFSRDSNSLRVYSGRSEDVAGFELARADLNNVDTSAFVKNTDLSGISISAFSDVMYLTPPTPGQILVWSAEHEHFMPEDVDLSGGGATVDVSDTVPSDPSSGNLWLNTETGKLYIYVNDGTSSQWIEPATTGGGGSSSSSDASTLNGQGSAYYLNYNNFTNTPTIPTVPTTLSDLTDVSATAPSSGEVLKWNGTSWAPAADLQATGGGGGIALTDLSVTQNAANGGGSLAYNNTTGVFSYAPPDLSGYLTSYTETSTLANITARGATTNDAVTINNTLTVDTLETSNAGTPQIDSTSSFSITAPDGVTINGVPTPVHGGYVTLGASPTWTGSSGISGVTQNASGDYTVSFSSAYASVSDYQVVATINDYTNATGVYIPITRGTSSFDMILYREGDGASVDVGDVIILIYEF